MSQRLALPGNQREKWEQLWEETYSNLDSAFYFLQNNSLFAFASLALGFLS